MHARSQAKCQRRLGAFDAALRPGSICLCQHPPEQRHAPQPPAALPRLVPPQLQAVALLAVGGSDTRGSVRQEVPAIASEAQENRACTGRVSVERWLSSKS